MFVECEEGFINVNSIERIKTASDGTTVIVSGERRLHPKGDVFDVVEALGTIVPNNSNISAVEFGRNDDGTVWYGVCPIIAWRISSKFVTGIMPDGDEAHYLMLPDGRVQYVGFETFDDLDHAIQRYAEMNLLKVK